MKKISIHSKLTQDNTLVRKKRTHQDQLFIDNTKKLRNLIDELPSYVKDYFRAIEPTTSVKTCISYAYDLRVFFIFLLKTNPSFKNLSIRDIRLNDLDKIMPVDIEEYLEYLKSYDNDEGEARTNSSVGRSRKLSALRSFYSYFFKRKRINSNPAALIDTPKITKKSIIKLDPNEVVELLDYMDNLEMELSGQKLTYFKKTKLRDIAIVTLLLGTGIRVSECTGLNIADVDFNNNGIKITRKGGNEAIIYFGDEVDKALKNYIEVVRNITEPFEGHEDALFLSLQKKRISVDAVENLVKKYAQAVVPLKKITPHKLRATYGTNLYQESSDIYLVAEVLGHSDISTTRDFYASMSDTRKREAIKYTKLRNN